MNNKLRFSLVVLCSVFTLNSAQNQQNVKRLPPKPSNWGNRIYRNKVASAAYYPPGCDSGENIYHRDGVVRNVSVFPWIGLLKIRFRHERTDQQIYTGILLIHKKYALSHAEDLLSSIQYSRSKMKALFVTSLRRPWVCKVKGFILHPDVFSKPPDRQAIALVHLVVKIGEIVPVKPVCWPTQRLKTKLDYYVVGYTIGNSSHHIKKIAVQVERVANRTLCSEFYSRNNMNETEKVRFRSQCFVGSKLPSSCVWDNGMMLFHNTSGPWIPVGVGIAGGGCGVPSGFFKLAFFWQWIERTISSEGMLKENLPPTQKKKKNPGQALRGANSFHSNRYDLLADPLSIEKNPDQFGQDSPQHFPGVNRGSGNYNPDDIFPDPLSLERNPDRFGNAPRHYSGLQNSKVGNYPFLQKPIRYS